MTRTLIDTDILSDFLRGKNVHVVDRANAYLRDHGRFTISVVTVFEIVRGRHQANQLDRALKFLEWTKRPPAFVLPLALSAERRYVAGRRNQECASASTLPLRTTSWSRSSMRATTPSQPRRPDMPNEK